MPQSMRRLRRCFLTMAGVPMLAGGCGAPIWHLNPSIATDAAKRENKPLLIYFKTWDSPLHRDMKLKTFEHPPIKQLLRETVNVELAYGWFPEEARKYRISSGQVCLLCDPEGREISRLYLNPPPTEEKFLEWLRTAHELALARTPAVARDPSEGGRAGDAGGS